MFSTRRTLFALGLFLASPAALFAATQDGEPPVVAAQECRVTFEPTSVAVGTDPVVVGFSLSEEIGPISAVTAADGSGLVVSQVDSDRSTVSFATESAQAGEWDVTFHGSEDRSCVGSVSVSAGANLR